ncbi:hypothetical protein [Bacillus cereus]|uniref:Uncharacterized protein n=1 Tax=Bacillus cereus TaxID=1396 RepID=A0A9X6VKD9_BACCE|nr:hypothetical protein [Bacillus cereus]PFD20441.1 hypothetical protein CN263_17180 [Bacillus cereus]PFW77359.1 hypothetical protein COL27_25865 [Bacillus sp. AFS075960]
MFINERSKRIVVTTVIVSMMFFTFRIVSKSIFSTFEASDSFLTFITQAMRVLDIIGALALIVLSFLFLWSLFDTGNNVKESPERKHQVSESKHINLQKNRLEKTVMHGTAYKNKVHGNQYHSPKDNKDLFDNILESSTFISVYKDDSRGSSCTRNNDSETNWGYEGGNDYNGGSDFGGCD